MAQGLIVPGTGMGIIEEGELEESMQIDPAELARLREEERLM